MLLWNVDALDWKLKEGGQWVDHAIDQIEGRENCILLMHDIHRSTVDHVERLIQSIKRVTGHRFTLY
jgi:peptidoglycan-N-acetylglucosamine deacetylase